MISWRIPIRLGVIQLVLVLRPVHCSLTDIESQFVDVPSPDEARLSLKHIASKPHVAGTPGDLEVRRVCGLIRGFGFSFCQVSGLPLRL